MERECINLKLSSMGAFYSINEFLFGKEKKEKNCFRTGTYLCFTLGTFYCLYFPIPHKKIPKSNNFRSLLAIEGETSERKRHIRRLIGSHLTRGLQQTVRACRVAEQVL